MDFIIKVEVCRRNPYDPACVEDQEGHKNCHQVEHHVSGTIRADVVDEGGGGLNLEVRLVIVGVGYLTTIKKA